MSTQIILKVLAQRHRLRQRDRWTRRQLEEYQGRALRLLREHAYARSHFYRRFHKGFTDRPLDELPVLTKQMVMEHFDEFVTDPTIRLADVEAHLATLSGGDELFNGRYRVASTSGSTGRRGLFLWEPDEWATVLTSYNRSFDWASVGAGLTHRTRMAVVSSTTPWHQSARVGASVHSPWVPTLRLDSGESLESIVERLNAFRPKVLVAYASMAHLLAEEQLAGRLRIAPGFVFASSEVFTEQARRRVEEAWSREPFEVYAATEPAGIASECEQHSGMHLFEDLVITEVVDENNKLVPPGVYGEKVLVTVLFSRTMPLIRYEMSDSVRPASSPQCPCGRPFALIDGIQGREEDVLRFPAKSGEQVSVQPIVFHRVMDAVPAGGWQVAQGPEGLTVLLSGVRGGFADAALIDSLRRELEAQGVIVPPVKVSRVPTIPAPPLARLPLSRPTCPGPGGSHESATPPLNGFWRVRMSRKWWFTVAAVLVTATLYRDQLRAYLEQASANVRDFDLPSAGAYDALVGSVLEGFYSRVAGEVAAAQPSGEVLEVGSGPGRLAVRLAREAPGVTLIGVDISDVMFERATRRAAGAGLSERVRFEVGDVAALPLSNGEFDGVVSTLSLHHWPDPASGLAEIYRVLKPGGEARIYDLAHWLWRPAQGNDRLAQIAAASSFGGGNVEVVRWPGAVSAFVLLRLRRRQESGS